MSRVHLNVTPEIIALGAQRQTQLCYLLVTISAQSGEARAVNWAFVADASRSMRIPIVDEAQFRALIREGGAQETLVDGVPVWQLPASLPSELRASVKSPLDHVGHALHTLLERLDNADRFALIACAESAAVLTPSAPGDSRAQLVRGIDDLRQAHFGDATNLSKGLQLGLDQLQRGRDNRRVDRLILLTDGFTEQPEACLALAKEAAATNVAISTLGLGGEFQEQLLTELADITGGQAWMVRRPSDIPKAVAAELAAARASAASALTLTVVGQHGALIRRITRIQPTLSELHEAQSRAATVRPGEGSAPIMLLVELLAPAETESRATIAEVTLAEQGRQIATIPVTVRRYLHVPEAAPAVREAAAWANVARLQTRARDQAAHDPAHAARLLTSVAARLDELGATHLAETARAQATAITNGATSELALKELRYATRRLGNIE